MKDYFNLNNSRLKIKSIKSVKIFFLCTILIFFFGQSFAQSKEIKPSGTISVKKLMAPKFLEDHFLGSKKAPVTIIEYGSLTCVHCMRFFMDVLPKLKDTYIKQGKVRYVFREFAFDPQATAGFMLARCAPKDKYYSFLEVLYEKAQNWATAPNPLIALSSLAKLGGFSDKKFQSCLQDKDLLKKINSTYEDALTLNIEGIPTFFINGDKYEGEMSFKELSHVIDKYLK